MYENRRQLDSDSEGCHTDMRIGIVGNYGDRSSNNTRVVVHNLAVIKGSFSNCFPKSFSRSQNRCHIGT